jgi:S-DNA-T family DNA segregation ATPase FtsK/SpoIIIE
MRKNKVLLASWALEMVTNYPKCFSSEDNPKDYDISSIISQISSYSKFINSNYSYMKQKTAMSVATLNFTFNGFLKVFMYNFTFNQKNNKITFMENDKETEYDASEAVTKFYHEAEDSLVDTHKRLIYQNHSEGIKNKEAMSLAKRIEKCFYELKVYVKVTPIEIKSDRYIFDISTMQTTKDTDISNNADTVQKRLRRYNHFLIDTSNKTQTKLIAAERELTDNSLVKILHSSVFENNKHSLPYAVGYDAMGEMCVEGLESFPHMLMGGTTNSGKSTALKCLLLSLAYKNNKAKNIKVLILDMLGKRETSYKVFENLPFMLCNVITQPQDAFKAILLLIKYLENKDSESKKGDPRVVVIIDEFPRLFSGLQRIADRKILEIALSTLMSGGRHDNIHLVFAAQDPKRNQMVCDIGNLPAKAAFRCDHYQRSVTILGRKGAEGLIGRGHMILVTPDMKDRKIHGAFITDEELENEIEELKNTYGVYDVEENQLNFNLRLEQKNQYPRGDSQQPDQGTDESEFAQIVMYILSQEVISSNVIQNEFKIGFNKAKRILMRLEGLGIVTPKQGRIARTVKPRKYEDLSAEAIDLLKRNNYSDADIRDAMTRG